MNGYIAIGMLVAATASIATADFTIVPPMMHSAGSLGNASNSVYMYTYSGPDVIVTGGEFIGSISSIIDGTTIGEGRWNVRNTRFGTTGSVSFQPVNLGYFANSVLVVGSPGGGMILKSGDILRIETFEAFDDGPGTDAVWNNISWSFQTAAITDLGNFESLSTIRTSGGAGFGTDTEIALYNSDGLLLRTNDDFGGTSGSGFSGLALADGIYYLAITPYDSFFSNGLARPGFAGTGSFDLSFNGLQVDQDVLAAYSTLLYKFTIGPECVADFNGDGRLDFFDYLDFVDAFSSALPAADFNGDGIVDFFDYLDFVDAFSIGC